MWVWFLHDVQFSWKDLILTAIASASLQYHGQYHYAPEAEEIEILNMDPENVDRKSRLDEFHGSKAHEALNPTHFVRNQSSLSDNHATVTVPEYSGSSPLSYHEPTTKFVYDEPTKPDLKREFSASSKHRLDPDQILTVPDVESFNRPFPGNGFDSKGRESRGSSRMVSPTRSRSPSPRTPQLEFDHEPRANSALKPRIPSRNTMTPPELYHKTEDYFNDQENTIISKSVKHVRPTSRSSTITPIATDDQQDNIVPPPLPPPLILPSSQSRAPSARTSNTRPTTAAAPPAAASEENENGLVAYFFSDYGNEGEADEDLISIDHSNFNVPTGADVVTDDETGSHMLRQSQASGLILQSAHKPPQTELSSALPPTIETNHEYRKEEAEEGEGANGGKFQREENDLTKKRVPTSPSVLPFSSPSPKQVLPASTIGNMQKQFSRNNSRSYDGNDNNSDHRPASSRAMFNEDEIPRSLQRDNDAEDEEKHSSGSQIRVQSSSLKSSHAPSRTQSSKSEQTKKDTKDARSSSSSSSSSASSSRTLAKDEDDQRSERHSSVKQKSRVSSRVPSRQLSALSHRTKSAEIVPRVTSSRKSSAKTSSQQQSSARSPSPQSAAPQSQREDSLQNIPRPQSIHYSPPPKPAPQFSQSRLNRLQGAPAAPPVSHGNGFPQSFNILVASPPPMQRNVDMRGPVSGNQPHTFSADSEHFLRDKSRTPYDLNQRLPSDYSAPRSGQSSHQSSRGNSPLPITLDSPDLDNNPPPTSRTVSPTKRHSIPMMELPADPRVMLTTTDAPDPDDPSIMQSTIHFQMFSSEGKPSRDVMAEYPQSNPLRNIVPSPVAAEEVSSTNEHPMESHRETNISPTQSKPEGRAASVSPFSHQVEEPRNRSTSPRRDEHQPEASNQTPLLSYPARLEDLMRPTPSPFPSVDDRQSPMDKPIAEHQNPHSIHPISSSKFTPHVLPSASHLRHPSISSENNHTSLEIEEPPHPPVQSPSPSLDDNEVVSPPPDPHPSTHVNPMPNRTSLSEPKEPTFITETPRHPSSERSASPLQEQQQDEPLRWGHKQVASSSTKQAPHHHSPLPRGSISNDDDLPYMTPSQQHSKLSLRLRKQEPKRKKSFHRSSSPIPQKDVGIPRKKPIDRHWFDHSTLSRRMKSTRVKVKPISQKNRTNHVDAGVSPSLIVSPIFKWKNDTY